MGHFGLSTAFLVLLYIGVLSCPRMASRVSCLLHNLFVFPLLSGWEPVTINLLSIALDLAHQLLQSKGSLHQRWHYQHAQKYTYQEFPQHFVWKKTEKRWDPRSRGFAIGQLFFVAPTAGEHFYLHTLLIAVKGPTCWEDLCTFNSVLYPTFHDAAFACGLLQDDEEWWQCLLMHHWCKQDIASDNCLQLS